MSVSGMPACGRSALGLLRAASALALFVGCASSGATQRTQPPPPELARYYPPPGRVADVTAISGLRVTRAEVAATVVDVARAQGLAAAVVGTGPDHVEIGPVEVAQCRATYFATFSPPSADPRVLVYIRGAFREPNDSTLYLVKAPDSGCGRDAWERLVRITIGLDSARIAGR